MLKLPREKLDALRIGVFTKSPGADWLLKNGLVDHAVSYSHQNGDITLTAKFHHSNNLLGGPFEVLLLG